MSNYNSKIYRDGDSLVLESGATLTIKNGATLAQEIGATIQNAQATTNIADATAITGGESPTEAEHNALVTKINAILALLLEQGLMLPGA